MSANLISIPLNLYPSLIDILGSKEALEAILLDPSKILSIVKFGHNASVGTTYVDIRRASGVKTYVTTAATATVVSDSVEDKADGTGAYTIKITGLREESIGVYVFATETINLNGTTPAPLGGSWFRIFRASLQTGGSNESNEGTITIKIGSNVEAIISIGGDNQTLTSCMSLPTNYVGILENRSFTTKDSTKVLNIRLQTRAPNQLFRTRSFYEVTSDLNRKTQIVIAAGSDIRVQCKINSGFQPISAEYILTLIPIPEL